MFHLLRKALARSQPTSELQSVTGLARAPWARVQETVEKNSVKGALDLWGKAEGKPHRILALLLAAEEPAQDCWPEQSEAQQPLFPAAG